MATLAWNAPMMSTLRTWWQWTGERTGKLLARAAPAPAIQSVRTGFRMQDAWDLTLHSLSTDRTGKLSPLATAIARLPKERIDLVRSELDRAEAGAGNSRRPKQYMRSEIMDAAAMSLYASHVLLLDESVRRELVERFGESFSDAEMVRLLVTNELRYSVLRTYAGYKYSDSSDRDWFECYLSVARKLMEARNASRPRGPKQDDVSGVNLGEYLQLLDRLKTQMLKVPSHEPVDAEKVLSELA